MGLREGGGDAKGEIEEGVERRGEWAEGKKEEGGKGGEK